jgi:uncharacterized protein (TIGR02722 family)
MPLFLYRFFGEYMKVRISISLMMIVLCFAFMSCGTTSSVRRVDADTQIDLSGYWNDTDVRIVCETLIDDCLDSPRIAQIAAEKRDLPVIIVGAFRNQSDEHLDTSIIGKRMEIAIINSGLAEFVASIDERDAIRDERADQLTWAEDGTAAEFANETAADFYLSGSVKTIVDQADNKMVRTYFVYAELTDIESNRVIWIGENDDIKKIITNARLKF